MMENLVNLEKIRRKAFLLYFIILLGVALVVTGFILMMTTGASWSFALLIIGIIVAVVAYVIQRSMASHIKKNLITRLICDNCGEDATYVANGRIPEFNEILQLGLVKYPDRYYTNDYYATIYKGVRFDCCDVRLQERQVRRDSKGNTRVTYVDYFNGRMLAIDTKQFNNIITIREKGSITARLNGLTKVQTEIIALNERYTIEARDKERVFSFLTPTILKGLVDLEGMVKGVLSYFFYNSKLYVFVERASDALEIRLTRKLDQKEIDFLVNALRLPLNIIDLLQLNE